MTCSVDSMPFNQSHKSNYRQVFFFFSNAPKIKSVAYTSDLILQLHYHSQHALRINHQILSTTHQLLFMNNHTPMSTIRQASAAPRQSFATPRHFLPHQANLLLLQANSQRPLQAFNKCHLTTATCSATIRRCVQSRYVLSWQL